MNIAQVNELILADDDFVEQQLEQFLTYYKLKHTIRWDQDRGQDTTESVAEHVYGMQVLAQYFLPLHLDLDPNTVHSLIIWHDMAEAIVSDVVSHHKTDEDRDREKAAEYKLFTSAAPHLRERVEQLLVQYHAQETRESQFVKAIDKVEIPFQLYFMLHTKHLDAFDLGRSAEEYQRYRKPYIEPFPLINRFDEILEKHINDSQYFPGTSHDTIV